MKTNPTPAALAKENESLRKQIKSLTHSKVCMRGIIKSQADEIESLKQTVEESCNVATVSDIDRTWCSLIKEGDDNTKEIVMAVKGSAIALGCVIVVCAAVVVGGA